MGLDMKKKKKIVNANIEFSHVLLSIYPINAETNTAGIEYFLN